MLQNIIVAVAMAAAIAYAIWRIRYVAKNAGGRCYGCPIKDVCGKKLGKGGLSNGKTTGRDGCLEQKSGKMREKAENAGKSE